MAHVRIPTIAHDTWRVLTFRSPSAAIAQAWPRYLAFGLICTWIAGIGRHWDNPRAELWQLLGLGSLAYVVVLALLIWLIMIPLRPQRWSYRNVLIFICLTSPPAWLYAIPVERFLTLEAAQTANIAFLAVVATWRVALLVWFLRSIAQLTVARIVVGTLLPLSLIVVTLSVLNLEHVVFNLMAGIDPEQRSANDTAFFVVFLMAFYSIMAAPLLLLAYAVLIHLAWTKPDPE